MERDEQIRETEARRRPRVTYVGLETQGHGTLELETTLESQAIPMTRMLLMGKLRPRDGNGDFESIRTLGWSSWDDPAGPR